ARADFQIDIPEGPQSGVGGPPLPAQPGQGRAGPGADRLAQGLVRRAALADAILFAQVLDADDRSHCFQIVSAEEPSMRRNAKDAERRRKANAPRTNRSAATAPYSPNASQSMGRPKRTQRKLSIMPVRGLRANSQRHFSGTMLAG